MVTMLHFLAMIEFRVIFHSIAEAVLSYFYIFVSAVSNGDLCFIELSAHLTYMYSINTLIYVCMTIYKLLMKLGIQEVKRKLYRCIPRRNYSSQL